MIAFDVTKSGINALDLSIVAQGDRLGQRARGSNRGRLQAGNVPKWISSGVRAPKRECGRSALYQAT